jgi:hypothetical protein
MSRSKKQKQQRHQIIISEVDESAYLRKMFNLHPGLVYVKNPGIGPGVRQWVVADRDACASAAMLVWRKYVTVISAGPKRVMVAGRPRGQEAVIELWEDKSKLSSLEYKSQKDLEAGMVELYDAIGADFDPDSTDQDQENSDRENP